MAKPKISVSDKLTKALLHELYVHHAELEAQNEELREMQHRLEKVGDQYTDLFDFAPIGYLVLDKKGVILNINLTACDLLGYPRSQVIGKPFSIFVSNQNENSGNIPTFFSHLREVYSTESNQSCELLIKQRGNKSINVAMESISTVDYNGQRLNCRTTLKDLTNEKKTIQLEQLNSELKFQKEKAQNYVERSGSFFLELNLDGDITMINNVGCSILGFKPSDSDKNVFLQKPENCPLEGTNWFEQFIPKDRIKESKNRFEQLLKIKPQENKTYEDIILTRNGEERLISWNHSTMINNEGHVIGALTVGKDITEENKAQKILEERERMFRTLFESAAESIIILKDNGEIVSVNQAANSVFGYEKNELLGQSIETLIPQKLRGKHENHRDTYGKDAQTRSMSSKKNLYALRKEGTEFPVEISLSSYTNGDETLVMASINDITIRKAEQEKLENDKFELEKKVEERTHDLYKSQQLHETVARNFPNGVIMVLDEDFNYVFVEGNEMFKKGIISKDLIGTSFLQRINPMAVDEIKNFLQDVFNGYNGSLETRSNHNVHSLNAVAIDNGDGKIKQILVVSTNITKVKKAEEDILRLLKNEQELGKLKSRFVSMASHEFRTPLTSILNSTNLLSKYIDIEDSQEKQHSNVIRIKSSLKHLINILDDFLSLDKLEQRKIVVRETDIVIPNICNEIIDSFTGIIKNTSLIKYTHTGNKNVTTDLSIFKNILTNLLSNAIKYSPELSEIILETEFATDTLKIVVKDSGIGIPKNEQKNLFDRFFRAENAINIQGTGLGLNIVNNYLNLLDGRIYFESEQNKGTVFTVEIPIKKERI